MPSKRERDQRLLRAARDFIASGSLQDVARSYRLSPSWLSRAMRQHLPQLAPELLPDVERRLAELRARHPRVAANARWSRTRRPWAGELRWEVERFIRAVQGRERSSAARSAAHIRELLDQRGGDSA
jgi:hypothetical protein